MKLSAQRATASRSLGCRLEGALRIREERYILREKGTRGAMSDEMIQALGGFVTEVGDVEYVMFETILVGNLLVVIRLRWLPFSASTGNDDHT
jgi:hypothetical protein